MTRIWHSVAFRLALICGVLVIAATVMLSTVFYVNTIGVLNQEADKKIKLVLVYPMTTGRNFDEVLRVIDSLQLNAKHRVATPANWKQGEDVILTGAVSDEEAKKLYPGGWKTPKPYIRVVPQPR